MSKVFIDNFTRRPAPSRAWHGKSDKHRHVIYCLFRADHSPANRLCRKTGAGIQKAEQQASDIFVFFSLWCSERICDRSWTGVKYFKCSAPVGLHSRRWIFETAIGRIINKLKENRAREDFFVIEITMEVTGEGDGFRRNSCGVHPLWSVWWVSRCGWSARSAEHLFARAGE